MFLSLLYGRTAMGAWEGHFCFGTHFLSVKPSGSQLWFHRIIWETLQSTDVQSHCRTAKSESPAFIFYKIFVQIQPGLMAYMNPEAESMN